MTDPTRHQDLARMIRDIERRIANLEFRNQLTRAQADIDGATMIQIDADGLSKPLIPHPWWISPLVTVSITAASYTTAFECVVPCITGPDVSFTFDVQTGTGVTADLVVIGPGDDTDAVAVPALTNATYTCDFVHGLALGATQQEFLLRARRTAGATPVVITAPTPLVIGKTGTATAGGLS